MKEHNFNLTFQALIEKYCELLLGESSPELIEKVKVMAIYNYINKSMPPLVSHWNQTHVDAKDEIKSIFEEIKRLNEQYRQQKNN